MLLDCFFVDDWGWIFHERTKDVNMMLCLSDSLRSANTEATQSLFLKYNITKIKSKTF